MAEMSDLNIDESIKDLLSPYPELIEFCVDPVLRDKAIKAIDVYNRNIREAFRRGELTSANRKV
jgi:hypothetical protein